MRVITDNNYGADADGHRGITIKFYEIEESDREEITSQVQEAISMMNEDEDLPETLSIVLIDPISEEDVYLEINPKDYL